MNLSFNYVGSLLFLVLAVVGTTIVGTNSNQAWADVFEGTEGRDVIVGTPGDDIIDSKGGMMKISEIHSLVMVLEMM